MSDYTDQTVLARNKATGLTESVPLADYNTDKYEATPSTVVHTTRGGVDTANEPNVAPAMEATGEAYVPPERLSAEQSVRQRHAAFDTMGDKGLTFVEGMTDALSFGLLHERGDEGDIRRDVNGGSALLGEIAGIALGLKVPGPMHWMAETGEGVGASAAKMLFGAGEGRGAQLATRAFGEAGANAVLSAAGATGHQVWDSVIDNKPMAAEAILHEAKMGTILGFGAGLVGGAFGRAASRADVEAGANIEGLHELTAKHMDDGIGHLDQSVAKHSANVGGLRQLAEDGLVPWDSVTERDGLLRDVGVARAKIELSTAEALKLDPEAASKWREDVEDYQRKVLELDKAMKPTMGEMAQHTTPLGEPVAGPVEPGGRADKMAFDGRNDGKISGMADEGNNYIHGLKGEAKAKFLADYERIHGEPWQPVPRFGMEEGGLGHSDENLDKIIAENNARFDKPLGSENLGGQDTPTSDLGTNAGKVKKPGPLASAEVNGEEFADLAHHQMTDARTYDPQKGNASEPEWMRRQRAESHARGRQLTPDTQIDQVASEPAQAAPEPAPGLTHGHPETPDLDPGPSGNVDAAKVSGPHKSYDELKDSVSAGEKLDRHERFKQFMDKWAKESAGSTRSSPGADAAAKIQIEMQTLMDATKGRLDSAGSLELSKALGMSDPASSFGERFQQAYSIKHAANIAAGASKSTAQLGGVSKSKLLDWMKRRAGGKIGAAVFGAAVGHTLGGPLGYFLGAGMAAKYAGVGGRVAGSIGRMSTKIAKAGDALLSGVKPKVAIGAIAANRHWSYSDRGEIADPIERIKEIQHVASHPELIAARVEKAVGDLAVVHPEVVDHITKLANQRMVSLSMAAPKFVWDKLGRPLNPSAGDLRRFLEHENAVNDLEGTLDSFARGSITRAQASGFADGWPEARSSLIRQVLGDQDALKKMSPVQLRNIELITGLDLTGLSDGEAVARHQEAWGSAKSQNQENQPGGPGKPQAFKIGSDKKIPNAAPTSSESFGITGRAPGN